MTTDGDLLWDAADKGGRWVPRLQRLAAAFAFCGLSALFLGAHWRWAFYAAGLYALGEGVHLVWDRARLVEVRVVADASGGPGLLRLRRVGGRTSEHPVDRVRRIRVVHSNVVADEATLRLWLAGRWIPLFGRPDDRPLPQGDLWRAVPGADFGQRAAWVGMPGIPD
ncbi:hypothetical protein ACSNOI_25965 [Actinomadura kijaniata]|uniref:hypothetical protein n=1 Tax=Actinomadura kijaniata TaxID=46161 RepID=UPI003F1C0E33